MKAKYTVMPFLAWIVTAISVLVGGYIGFAGIAGDRIPSQETMVERVAVVLGIQLSGALLIGLVRPRFWYLSALVGCVSIFWIVLNTIEDGAKFLTVAFSYRHLFSNEGNIAGWAVIGAPLFALAAGYVGSLVGGRLWKTEQK